MTSFLGYFTHNKNGNIKMRIKMSYPKVPSIGAIEWWVHWEGSHFASPKSEIYSHIQSIAIRPHCAVHESGWIGIGADPTQRYREAAYLGLEVSGQEDVGGLDVPVDYPSLTPFVQVTQPPCRPNHNRVPCLPINRRQILI